MPEHITRLIDLFLSTPSARRATKRARQQDCANVISIHALREEGDSGQMCPAQRRAISIHALREEGDRNVTGQPTANSYFYPRPPRGGRQTQ